MRGKSVSFKFVFGIIVITSFFLFCILILIQNSYRSVLEEKEMLYNVQLTNKTKEQFDFMIDIVNDVMINIIENEKVVQAISEPEGAGEGQSAAVGTYFENIVEMQSFINDISVMGVDGTIITTNPEYYHNQKSNYLSEYMTESFVNPTYEGVWTPVQVLENEDYSTVISYMHPLYDENTREFLGAVSIDVSYEAVHKMFIVSSIQLKDRALIVDKNGNILLNYPHFTDFSSVLEKYPELLKEETAEIRGEVFNQETFISSQTINRLDWKIIRLIEVEQVTSDVQNLSMWFRSLSILMACISVLYAVWYTKLLTKPLRKLVSACRQVEKGDLNVRVDVDTEDEFGHLGKTFNIMLEKLDEYFEHELEAEHKRSEMEFQILQAQINPHFLYNTLDSIKWLAVMQNVDNIAEMSTALINLLKYNLGKIEADTTLKDEIESVKNYIVIQKYRYGDIFAFTTDISEEAMECRVIRFILQPLVENCIIHGFNDMEEDYRIHVSADIYDGKLHVKVIDNGSGIDKIRKNELNEGIEKSKKFSHIGVKNIRERVKLYFGDEYDLLYDSEPNFATIAELILPVIREDQEEAAE